MLFSLQPAQIGFQQRSIGMMQSLDGFLIQPGALQIVAACANQRVDTAQLLQQADEFGAPQAGSAKCD